MTDLIKRSDALEVVYRYCPDDDGSCSCADRDLREMLDDIEDIPSADRPTVGYVGVDDDYLVSVKEVLGITAETGAMETQRRVRELPRIDRPQEWIPCSERLPKSYVEVLVCDDYGWINIGAYRPCDVSEDCSGWSIHAHTKIGTEEVIAWIPLPKPWEGADDE